MPLENAEVVVGVLHNRCLSIFLMWSLLTMFHLRVIVVAANPLTEGAAQSLLTSSAWSVHNPLVDKTLPLTLVYIRDIRKCFDLANNLSDEIIPLCELLVLKTLLLLRDAAALLALVLLDLRRTLLPVVPVGNVLLWFLLRAAAPKVDSLWVGFSRKDKRCNKYCPGQPHFVSNV